VNNNKLALLFEALYWTKDKGHFQWKFFVMQWKYDTEMGDLTKYY